MCNQTLPFHIADYKYDRNEFKVWCNSHISKAPAGATVFEFIKKEICCGMLGEHIINKGQKFAVTGPFVGTLTGNHPNSDDEHYIEYTLEKTKKGKRIKRKKNV